MRRGGGVAWMKGRGSLKPRYQAWYLVVYNVGVVGLVRKSSGATHARMGMMAGRSY